MENEDYGSQTISDSLEQEKKLEKSGLVHNEETGQTYMEV